MASFLKSITRRIAESLHRTLDRRVITRRAPDFVIGGSDDPYLLRWFLIPRNRVFNVYLHVFMRSDDDRALHCHPWINLSFLLNGEYTEHTIAAGGVKRAVIRHVGDIVARRSVAAHRVELHAGYCTTLFLTGPKIRTWGFHCPDAGWIPWQEFVDARDSGDIGRGCDQ